MAHVNIVGVQFRRAGKIFDFIPSESHYRIGDHVVVDTDRGPSLARIVRIGFVDDAQSQQMGLKPIMRMASEQDLRETTQKAMDEAMKVARSRVEHFNLNMRILKAEGQFGGNKFTIYFSAPGRVDFRDLVKDLASSLRARVELKQVGSRDEAKLVGGIGICGREYCCSSFLRDFVPVSIKMAKNQNLALNPSKVSGGCGRLLCCLTYENDAYIDLRSKLPPLKSRVRSIEEGVTGVVIKTDILNQLVVVETGDGRQVNYKVKDIEIVEASLIKEDPDQVEAESWAEDLDLANLVSEAPQKLKPQQTSGRDQQQRSHPSGRQGAPVSQQKHQGQRRPQDLNRGQRGQDGTQGRGDKPPHRNWKEKDRGPKS
jgi:cell fate regulator YaaT (PSP1 superfamily)